MGSKFEDKVTAVTDFLANRASQGRLSNHREVQTAVSEILAKRGQRDKSTDLDRRSIQRVLTEVDKHSWESAGVLLSSLVPHFWDNKPGRSLGYRLRERGISIADAQQAVFAQYGEFVPVSFSAPRVEVKNLDVEAKAPVYGQLTAEDVRAIIREELAKAPTSEDGGGGFDRSLTLQAIRDVVREELQDA
jgi:hypothetical protein